MRMRGLKMLSAGIGVLLSAHTAACPTKPVHIVNPYTPGGGVDVIGRTIATVHVGLLI
jgi:tripartite-type tricarboxylate transporter receptor subunit TctC